MSGLITIAGGVDEVDLSQPPTPMAFKYDDAPPRPEDLTYV